MIKVVVFDIDGTLYSRKERVVLDSTILALKKLKERGYIVVVATGRTFHNICKGVLSEYYDYLVAANGHVLMNSKSEMLFLEHFKQEETQALVDFCNERQLGLILKMDDGCYLYANHQSFNTTHWGTDGVENVYQGIEDHHLTNLVNCAYIKCAPEDKIDFKSICPSIKFVHTGTETYDVYYENLDKAITIERLLKDLNLTWDNCLAIGDGMNDVEMISKAKIGVAMGDGHDAIIKIADFITTGSREDGIYHALQTYELI